MVRCNSPILDTVLLYPNDSAFARMTVEMSDITSSLQLFGGARTSTVLRSFPFEICPTYVLYPWMVRLVDSMVHWTE